MKYFVSACNLQQAVIRRLKSFSLDVAAVGDSGFLDVCSLIVISDERAVRPLIELLSDLKENYPKAAMMVVCGNMANKELLRPYAEGLLITDSFEENFVGDLLLARLVLKGNLKGPSDEILGTSPELVEAIEVAQTLAPLDRPVYIGGERGSGKELFAQRIHQWSGRKGDFIGINCSSLEPERAESELFGHRKGAYTGADDHRLGAFREAGQGTVFLDEIGELPLKTQAKLLRALQEQKVRPLGETKEVSFHCRILVATNRNLTEEIEKGRLREDFYDRISGFEVHLPPLRERRIDIGLLADFFLKNYNDTYGKEIHLPQEALAPLLRYQWPGNVRELANFIEFVAAFTQKGEGPLNMRKLRERLAQLHEKTEGAALAVVYREGESFKDFQARTQKEYFESLLRRTNGVRNEAIRLSGMSRATFFNKLKESGITK